MITIAGVSKSYISASGAEIRVFENLNMHILPGEFVSIFGPNGCGKTTLLNLISGVDTDFEGSIYKASGQIAYVFQSYRESIFPWLTVEQNIAYPLKVRGYSTERQREHVQQVCNQFDVGFALSAYPYGLSGGQQQLVNIMRALIMKPDVLIMDEPFSALDYQTTVFMLSKLQDIWQKTGVTIIFISHHVDESILLAQKIFLLSRRPTRVVKEFSNAEPYPRITTFAGTERFASLKHEILSLFLEQINEQ